MVPNFKILIEMIIFIVGKNKNIMIGQIRIHSFFTLQIQVTTKKGNLVISLSHLSSLHDKHVIIYTYRIKIKNMLRAL